MITGRQIREARALLLWPVSRLADLARVSIGILTRAEANEGEAPLSSAHEARIRGVLERAGVEILSTLR